jgi:hypothetical protein
MTDLCIIPADRQYRLEMRLWTGFYVAVVFGLSFADRAGMLTGPLGVALSILPAVPIAGIMVGILRLMQRSDEYVRALTAKRFVVASGISYSLAAAWGFAETFAQAPHAPMWLMFPGFWVVFGLTAVFIRTTR